MASPVHAKRIDWLVIGPVIYLTGISLVVLKSIELTTKTPLDFSFSTQITAAALALAMIVIIVRSQDLLLRSGLYLYLASLVLLVIVLLYGDVSGGAKRWVEVGSWQFQPSELAKLSLILVQAKLLVTRRHSLNTPWPLFLSVFYLLPTVWLVLAQPDLGTVVILIAVWLGMLFMSDLPKRTFVLLLGLVLLVVPASYPFLADYQRQRIDSFFNPSLSTQAEGYNALQATIAVGSGGFIGRGLDSGTQSQLNFLPSQHTDFIFAVISEKLGFLGALSLILAFATLLIRLIYLSWQSGSQAVRLVGIGVVATIGLQFLINVGMNLGLAPVTGVPLPFVSGGGTHVVVESIMVGLVLGLAAAGRHHLYRR